MERRASGRHAEGVSPTALGGNDALETCAADLESRRVTCGARDAPLRAGETPALQEARVLAHMREKHPSQGIELSW